MAKPRGCCSVGVWPTSASVPLPGSTLKPAIVLVPRSLAYRNLPSGVRCRSAAQIFSGFLSGSALMTCSSFKRPVVAS